jgi:hypothetical protein
MKSSESSSLQREQRRDYCQGSKPDHFCDTSQSKYTEASTETPLCTLQECRLAPNMASDKARLCAARF